MGQSIRYYVSKIESYLKNAPDGLSDYDLAMRLNISMSTWNNIKAMLKAHPTINYNSSSKYWKFIKPEPQELTDNEKLELK